MKRRRRVPRFVRTPSGAIGIAILAFLLAVIFIGPLVAPHPINQPLGIPGEGPSSKALLGTDAIGRDVLSRTLHGGLSVLELGLAATLLSYLFGITVGLVAGYSRTMIDPILMRGVDLLLAFPALLILLLLVAGLGTATPVLLLGVVMIQLPGISRVVRTATLDVSTRGFVDAAIARGERTPEILLREITPNIAPILLADIGIRFGLSIILIASMNYLNFGLQPPAADWALMITENRQIIGTNPWAVVAPAALLALLTIGVNLVTDAYARTLGRSGEIEPKTYSQATQPVPAGASAAPPAI